MRPLRSFRCVPRLPRELEGLNTLAQNLWWHWNHTAAALFRSLNPDLWEETNHNAVAMLGRLSPEELAAIARDDPFRFRLRRAIEAFDEYRGRVGWFQRTFPRDGTQPLVAYFCAEYGLAEFFRIYSGGLGVLAGDYLKAASDLGVPLVAVGLFYHRGYFQQRLSLDGWQMEGYPFNDPTQLPMTLMRDAEGRPHRVEVLIGGERAVVQIWRVDVGCVALYLLDTNIPDNPPHLRSITDRLYGGDDNHRLSQEIVLGIGGVRALAQLGIEPDIFHMNEGHAAFLTLERLRRFVAAGLPLPAAIEAVTASNVFTTHTPVPAGNKAYPNDLLEYHLRPYLNEIGVSSRDFLAYGQIQPGQGNFGMTVFALHFSSYANGVSRLHGQVSRNMWQGVWKEIPAEEIPISHVTNGTHITTWVGDEMADLYDSYLGPRWRDEPHNEETWARIDAVPSAEIWRAHERSRERLIGVARSRLARQLVARHASPSEIEAASEVLDSKTLTIGFARRVATYKRLRLLLQNPDRLTALLTNPDRPVQLLIAGKAHPDDNPAKEIIRSVVEFGRRPEVRRHVVFLENYDIGLASMLVAGADVWLNTPRRPLEASGTSGMKAAVNGALNVSVLDGWWDEAYADAHDGRKAEIGWAIGNHDTETASEQEMDAVDANVLYTLLERDVVPLFYQRTSEGVPRAWVERMKHAIRYLAPRFNTHRMAIEYVEQAYMPVAARRRELSRDHWAGARELGNWKARVRAAWPKIRIENVDISAGDVVVAATPIKTRVEIDLGDLTPEDVIVQIAVGRISLTDIAAPMEDVHYTTLAHNAHRSAGNGKAVFDGSFTCTLSGHVGVTARVLPSHPLLVSPVTMGAVLWA